MYGYWAVLDTVVIIPITFVYKYINSNHLRLGSNTWLLEEMGFTYCWSLDFPLHTPYNAVWFWQLSHIMNTCSIPITHFDWQLVNNTNICYTPCTHFDSLDITCMSTTSDVHTLIDTIWILVLYNSMYTLDVLFLSLSMYTLSLRACTHRYLWNSTYTLTACHEYL